jgi:hypothetical protein
MRPSSGKLPVSINPVSVAARGINREMSTQMTFRHQEHSAEVRELVDRGAGDHDQPYRFGWRPRSSEPYPFNTRQYARLLIFRSRVQERLAGDGDEAAISWPPPAA